MHRFNSCQPSWHPRRHHRSVLRSVPAAARRFWRRTAALIVGAALSSSAATAGLLQTITFSRVVDQFVGAPASNLVATSSSGLPVTFTTLTPATCAVSGSKLTALAAGACTVRAAQAGDTTYDAAVSVAQSITVSIVSSGPLFQVPVNHATGLFPDGMATADFNGDGIPDLAIANWSEGTVSVLLGQGDGSFAPALAYAAGVGPMALVARDFNADGKVDLAVTNLLSQDVSVLLGKGDGAFLRAASVPVGVALFGIAAGDLDGDGRADLVVTNGTSGGVPGQSVVVLLGNGDGTFRVSAVLPTGANPMAVAIRDLDGDGVQDLVVANADANTVAVLLGTGGGQFRFGTEYAVGWSPQGLALADLDGDGRIDLVVANAWSNSVSVLLNRGSGVLAPGVTYAAGTASAGVVLADLDGDGKLDAAVFDELGDDIVVLSGTGSGAFGAPVHYGVAAQPMAIATADFNGDGRADLAVAGGAANAVSVLLNASAAPAAGTLAIVAGTPQSAAINTAFAAALTVVVKSGTGTPVAGATVTFTAPASGASGLFGATRTVQAVTSSTGVATAPAFVANAVAGTYAVLATVNGLSATFTLTNIAAVAAPPSFTSAPPPNGIFNTAYSHQLTASGAPSPTFSVSSSALPPGLTLNATTGSITGLPSSAGTFAGMLLARNGTPPDATQTFAITIAPAPQSITFGVIADRAMGSDPFTVTATASSGLPVAFATMTPAVCSLNAATVTALAAGTCTVRATQTGNASYTAAAPADRSFSVTRAAQTITFISPAALRLNAGGIAAEAVATSGLAVGVASITPAICVMNGPLVYARSPGTCTLRASQAGDANFQAAVAVDQSFTVQPAFQMITFAIPDAHALADSPVALSAFTASGLPIAFVSQTPTVCSISGAAAKLLTTGTCTVQASQAGNASFAAAPSVTRSFPVVAAIVTTTPPPATAPLVEYMTRFGGTGADRTFNLAVAADGAAYVAGSVASTDFPGIDAATITNAGIDLLFVSRLTPETGARTFTTVVGTRSKKVIGAGAMSYIGPDQVEAIAVDAGGSTYVVAYAYPIDLPVRAGTFGVAGSKFVYRVSSTGSMQQVAGPLDGAVQTVRALAIDGAGNLYLTGVAGAGLGTTSGAAVSAGAAVGGGPYLLKLSPAGATIYSTYLTVKGSRSSIAPATDQSTWDTASTGYAVVIDAAGNAYVAGQALAADLPVTGGSPDTADTQNRDAFVLKVSPTGQALLFVARLGGGDAERATDVVLAPDGSLLVGGKSASLPFVGTTNAFQTTVAFDAGTVRESRETAFIAKLAADGSAWRAVAAIGSSGGSLVKDVGSEPYPLRLAVDPSGAVYAAGTTFPNRSLPLVQNEAGTDVYGAFVMKIAPDLSALRYSTTLGGGVATGLAVDAFGNAYVSGYDVDAFVAKLNDRTVPLALAADVNPAIQGQVVTLRAVTADARYSGTVDFSDAGRLLGSVPVASGTAMLAIQPTAGVHRFQAIFRGTGQFGKGTLAELIVVVNPVQAAP